jgi:hypothetical protein
MKSASRQYNSYTDSDILDYYSGDINSDSSVRFGDYFPFFSKPKLRISVDPDFEKFRDERWGTLRETDPEHVSLFGVPIFPLVFYPERIFININVKNTGRGLARNCEARLRLVSKLDGCEGLTPSSKSLIWESGENTIDILPKSRRSFHLIFAQERTTSLHENQIRDLECSLVEGKRKKIFPIAWVSTRRTTQDILHGELDGLCLGTFELHVEVSGEKGNVDKKHFTINIITNEYKQFVNTEIKGSDCNCD